MLSYLENCIVREACKPVHEKICSRTFNTYPNKLVGELSQFVSMLQFEILWMIIYNEFWQWQGLNPQPVKAVLLKFKTLICLATAACWPVQRLLSKKLKRQLICQIFVCPFNKAESINQSCINSDFFEFKTRNWLNKESIVN